MLLLIQVFDYLSLAITVVTIAFAALLVLRMVLQWAQVNPFGWFALNLRRLTEPVMRPFRYGFDNQTMRFDMLPVVAAALVLLNGLFAAWIVGQISSVLTQFYRAPSITIGLVLSAFIWLLVVAYMAALFGRFLLPMLGIGYSSAFLRLAFQITEPVLKPLRKFLVIGAFDFSPIALIFVVQFVGAYLRYFLAGM